MPESHVPHSHSASHPRRPRKPKRTFLAGLLLIAFLLVVRFAAAGIQLPVFFQRLVGIVNAVLAMLVVVFAIREFAKKYNRLRWPLLGRVSTSRVAGGAVLLIVCAWWLSPWAPIPAGEVTPDLWRMADRELDTASLIWADEGLAVLVPPTPSAAARQVAARIGGDDPTIQQAIKAIVESRFDLASEILGVAAKQQSIDETTTELARAMAEIYRGDFSAASDRYGKLLSNQPRREDLLARGAFAAALAGQWPTADQRALQLFDQAKLRGREGVRFAQAASLLIAIRAAEGKFAVAEKLSQQTKALRERVARRRNLRDPALEAQLAVILNNQAVVQAVVSSGRHEALTADLLRSQELWNQSAGRDGQPAGPPERHAAVILHNLAALALIDGRLADAEQLVQRSIAIQDDNGAAATYIHSFSDKLWLRSRTEDSASDGKNLLQSMPLLARGLPLQHPYFAVNKIRSVENNLEVDKSTDILDSVKTAVAQLDKAGLGATPIAARGIRILGEAYLHKEPAAGN